MNKYTNVNNSSITWSRAIISENNERKDEKYGGQSETLSVYIIQVSEEKEMR